jgi:hypothetical protein
MIGQSLTGQKPGISLVPQQDVGKNRRAYAGSDSDFHGHVKKELFYSVDFYDSISSYAGQSRASVSQKAIVF